MSQSGEPLIAGTPAPPKRPVITPPTPEEPEIEPPDPDPAPPAIEPPVPQDPPLEPPSPVDPAREPDDPEPPWIDPEVEPKGPAAEFGKLKLQQGDGESQLDGPRAWISRGACTGGR